MRAPPLTYQFQTLKDTSGPTLEIVTRTFSGTVASALIQMNLRGIPRDKIFVLTAASVTARPGVGQTVVELDILGTTQALNLFNIKTEMHLAAILQPRSLSFSGEIWIQGGGDLINTVSVAAVFDAGVAGNVANMAIHGFVIPRGNAAVF